ncbi:MAG: thiosulfate oxidation carrier complex protein SoxZ [Pseudomonadota bacterium]
MAKVKPRVKVPKKAKAGETITIKTLISHPMESGQRKDRKTGELIPRKIINKFVATFNGETVVDFTIDPAVSANPYFEFDMVVPEAGTVRFEWTDDDGAVYDIEKSIAVTA